MNSRISNIFLSFSLMLVCTSINAQDSIMLPRHPPKPRFWDNVFTGGNVGLQFGTVTFVEVSPLLGYAFTEKIQGGIGLTYQYYQYQDQSYNIQSNVYGGRIFGRYFFTSFLFAHAEYEYLNLDAYDFYPAKRRVDVESLLAGGGFFQRSGTLSGFYIMLLHDFSDAVYSPYSPLILRVGINIGL